MKTLTFFTTLLLLVASCGLFEDNSQKFDPEGKRTLTGVTSEFKRANLQKRAFLQKTIFTDSTIESNGKIIYTDSIILPDFVGRSQIPTTPEDSLLLARLSRYNYATQGFGIKLGYIQPNGLFNIFPFNTDTNTHQFFIQNNYFFPFGDTISRIALLNVTGHVVVIEREFNVPGFHTDTIGYIPKWRLDTLKTLSYEAFRQGNWAEIYRLIDEYFVWYLCDDITCPKVDFPFEFKTDSLSVWNLNNASRANEPIHCIDTTGFDEAKYKKYEFYTNDTIARYCE